MNSNLLVNIGGRTRVPPDNIILLKADSNYTVIYLDDGRRFLSSTNIGVLEKRLNSFQFFRTHRSIIINLRFVSRIDKDSGANRHSGVSIQSSLLKEPIFIPLSRRKSIAFFTLLDTQPQKF